MNDKSGWIFAIASYRFLEAFWTEDYDPLQGRFFSSRNLDVFCAPFGRKFGTLKFTNLKTRILLIFGGSTGSGGCTLQCNQVIFQVLTFKNHLEACIFCSTVFRCC